jgi:hypothetical protein
MCKATVLTLEQFCSSRQSSPSRLQCRIVNAICLGQQCNAQIFGILGLSRAEATIVLIACVVLCWVKGIPGFIRGMGAGISAFRNGLDGLDRHAHDTGQSAGGIFGKPAFEALTPENQTGELYDPEGLFKHRKRPVGQWLLSLWRSILRWLRIKP